MCGDRIFGTPSPTEGLKEEAQKYVPFRELEITGDDEKEEKLRTEAR